MKAGKIIEDAHAKTQGRKRDDDDNQETHAIP
jgi:hypothetical protein